MNTVTTIVVAIIGSGFLTAVYTEWRTSKRGKQTENTAERTALLALCRDRILTLSKSYKYRGEMPVDEYEAYDGLVDAYEKLGGNGAVKRLAEEIKTLPIKNA